MSGFGQDVRSAFRVFRRETGFAVVVVATLAIGTGGVTAVYSVVRGVVLAPLPFADSERVVVLWGRTPEYPRAPLTVGDLNELRSAEAFESSAAAWGNTALLLGGERAEQVSVGWVTPGYFELLGVGTAVGRVFAPDDELAVVLSHDLWVRRFGADPSVVGQTVDLGNGAMEVVGVLPADRDPNLAAFSGAQTDYDLWRPMPPDWVRGDDRSVGWLRGVARLRDGVSIQAAQAEVDALIEQVNATVTERDGGTDLRVDVIPARRDLVGDVSRTLWILLGAVAGVLLIAAVNVAHLMLARGEARRGEVAVRAALGGTRWQMVRRFLAESGALALVGGLAGVVIAWAGVTWLVAIAPTTLPRMDAVTLDGSVFAFASLATLLSAIVFGLVPAARATRTDLVSAMSQRRSTRGVAAQRLSRGLVIVQVALSLVLVTGTASLLRSLVGLSRADLGFEPSSLLTFALEAPDWGESDAEGATRLAEEYDAGISAVPGVRAVGFTNRVPLGGGLYTGTYRSETMAAQDDAPAESSFRFVSPGYFEAMGARLVAGRSFRFDDTSVAVVDQLVAERLWPNRDPIGQRIETATGGGDAEWVEVVGVVAPMKHASVDAPAAETVLLPLYPRANRVGTRWAVVRTEGAPLPAVEGIRDAIRAVDANAVAARVRTMDSLVADSVAPTRFATLLLVVFGAIALILAAVGLHGVMAFHVRRRAREMGIRMALGAERRTMLGRAFRSGLALVAVGMAVGIVASLGMGRALASLLYEVEPGDVTTLVGSAVVILTVGAVGAYVPARLVLGVDPSSVLREE